jgi:ubiquitin-conjugating enzyme E2 M
MKGQILIHKEIMSIDRKEYRKSSFEDQVIINYNPDSSPFDVVLKLCPRYGYFFGTKIAFKISLGYQYPGVKPTVKCLDSIFHPNISSNGNICFSMFDSDWCREYRIEHYINGLLWLLSSPNFNSPISGGGKCSESEFASVVAQTSMGTIYKKVKYSSIFEFHETIQAVFKSKGLEVDKRLENPYNRLVAKGMFFRFKDTETFVTGGYVTSLARQLDVDPSCIVKSVIFRNDKDDLVLVLTNGKQEVWEDHIQEIAKDGSLLLMPTKALEDRLGYERKSIPVLGSQVHESFSKIIVNRTIENQEMVYIESGVKNVMMVISPKYLFAALGMFTMEQIRTYTKPKWIKLEKFKRHWKCMPGVLERSCDVAFCHR